MSSSSFSKWYIEGLQALKTADEKGKDASSRISEQISDPRLKKAFDEGVKIGQKHTDAVTLILERAAPKAKSAPNPIIDGMIEGAKAILGAAGDPMTRDAGIVAGEQIQLHYFIATYGTLASVAKHLGLSDDAKTFKRLSEEATAADQEYTNLAETITNVKAA